MASGGHCGSRLGWSACGHHVVRCADMWGHIGFVATAPRHDLPDRGAHGVTRRSLGRQSLAAPESLIVLISLWGDDRSTPGGGGRSDQAGPVPRRARCRWVRRDGQGGPNALAPTGFQDTVVFNGLTDPIEHPIRLGRADLRRREVRPHQGLRRASPTRLRPSSRTFAARSTTIWDRGLLGHDPRPELPDQPLRLRPVRAGRAIGGTCRAGTTPARSPPGPTTDGCVISGRLSA